MSAPTRREFQTWDLQVLDTQALGRDLLQIRFAAEGLDALRWQAGQDLMIEFPNDEGSTTRRRYSIRRLDPVAATVDLWFALHGSGPATTWARHSAPGLRVPGIGPRGNVVVDSEADWHLFVGDESSMGAIAAMIEVLDPATPARVVLSTDDPDLQHVVRARAGARTELTWLLREPGVASVEGQLAAALDSLAFPEGKAHGYVLGEISEVVRCRDVLVGRGIERERIDAKGYWSVRAGNLPHGEPERPDALR